MPIVTLGPVPTRKDKKPGEGEDFTSQGATSATAVYRPPRQEEAGQQQPISTADLANLARQGQQNQAAPPSDRSVGIITLYRNGFQIGQQPFRDIADKANAKFLADLMSGQVPAELEKMCRQEWGNSVDQVGVQLVDKTKEDFVPPKPKFDFNQSQGQAIGSEGKAPSGAAFSHARAAKVTVDTSLPTTILQLVLHPRNRVKETFNQDMTVLQLYQHIMSLTSQSRFDLLAGYPPKVLDNPNLTLKEAGLLGTSIQQRI